MMRNELSQDGIIQQHPVPEDREVMMRQMTDAQDQLAAQVNAALEHGLADPRALQLSVPGYATASPGQDFSFFDALLLPPMETSQLQWLLRQAAQRKALFSLWLRDGSYFAEVRLLSLHTVYEAAGPRLTFRVSARADQSNTWHQLVLAGERVADGCFPGERDDEGPSEHIIVEADG